MRNVTPLQNHTTTRVWHPGASVPELRDTLQHLPQLRPRQRGQHPQTTADGGHVRCVSRLHSR